MLELTENKTSINIEIIDRKNKWQTSIYKFVNNNKTIEKDGNSIIELIELATNSNQDEIKTILINLFKQDKIEDEFDSKLPSENKIVEYILNSNDFPIYKVERSVNKIHDVVTFFFVKNKETKTGDQTSISIIGTTFESYFAQAAYYAKKIHNDLKCPVEYSNKHFNHYASIFKRYLTLDPDCRHIIDEDDILPVSFDPTKFNFKYIDKKLIDSANIKDCYYTSEILSRMDYPGIFCTWFYSILIGKKTRQWLWLYGEGNDSKTTIAELIGKILSSEGTLSAYTKTTEFKNFNKDFEGKLLIHVDDSKHYNIPAESFVHNIAGGSDTLKIEGKGQNAIQVKNLCNLLFTENGLPKINLIDKSEKRRALIVSLDTYDYTKVENPLPSDKFKDVLYSERYAFIKLCEQYYNEYFDHLQGVIKTDSEYWEKYDEITKNSSMHALEKTLGELWVPDPTSKLEMSYKDLTDHYNAYVRFNNLNGKAYGIIYFIKFLKSKGIEGKRKKRTIKNGLDYKNKKQIKETIYEGIKINAFFLDSYNMRINGTTNPTTLGRWLDGTN